MRIELLGGLNVLLDGQAAPRFRSQKPPALLAYLAYFADRHHPRELLIEMLWPDAEPEAGRNRLSVTTSRIKSHLQETSAAGESCTLGDRYHLWINADLVVTDVAELEARLAAADKPGADRIRHLAEAVDLYRGPLLPGFYESWIAPEQERLSDLIQAASSELVRLLTDEGRFDEALVYAKRRVAAEPLREEAHRDLIRLLVRTGRAADAVQQFRALERILSDELGVAPDPETQALVAALPACRTASNGYTHTPASVAPAETASKADHRDPDAAPWSIEPPATAPFAPAPRSTTRPRLLYGMAGVLCAFVLVMAAARRPTAEHPNRTSVALKSEPEARPPLWVAKYEHAADEHDSELTAVTSDAAGAIYATGFCKTKKNDVDLLILKYSQVGELLWRHRYNGPGNDCDRGRHIALDPAGNVLVTGDSYNGDRAKRGTEWDVVTVKCSPSGERLWARRYNHASNGDDYPAGLGIDSAGSVYVAERTQFPDKSVWFTVAKFRPDGAPVWVAKPPPNATGFTTTDVGVNSFSVSENGTSTMTGEGFNVDAGGRKMRDMFAFRYDRNGNLLWGRRFAPENVGWVAGVVAMVDPAENFYVVTANSPERPLPEEGKADNSGGPAKENRGEEATIVKYNPRGEVLWTHPIGKGEWRHNYRPFSIRLGVDNLVYVGSLLDGKGGAEGVHITVVDQDGRGQWADSDHRVVANGMVTAAGSTAVVGGLRSDNPGLGYNVIRVQCYSPGFHHAWFSEYRNEPGVGVAHGALHRDPLGNFVSVGQTRDGAAPRGIVIKFAP